MAETLFHKVWNAHTVRTLPSGQTQLFVGLHLVHEVTSPQAFDMLRQHGWRVAFPERTFATVDHIVPTDSRAAAVPRPDGRGDDRARSSATAGSSASTCAVPDDRANQGIVHVIGPELGLTQPGHDDRVRRQPHVHARRARRDRVRHRHLAGARRAGLAVPGARAAQGAPHRRQRPARAGRLRQGRDPHDHPPARRPGRRRLRLRVRRHARSTRCRSTSA